MTEAFTWGSGGQRLTPSERRRRVAEAMLKAGSDTSPVQHWAQGAARVAQAIMGGLQMRRENEAEAAAEASAASDAALLGTPGATATSAAPATVTSNDVQPGSGDPQNALDAIMKYESAGKNVHQNVVPAGGGFNPSTGTVTGPSSASGYFQMINPTWRSAAKLAGVDTSQYPTAMSAPYEAQRKVAAALFAKEGFAPWAPYNAALRSHIAKRGGAGAFINDGAPAQVADLPAAGAASASMETGQPGFAVPGGAPTMDASTFNAIHEGQPLQPVFQSEGASQPWMGSTLGAPAAPQVAQTPMPPPRPADLAMPQADIPAPGAVAAMGQMPAAAPPVIDPNSPDAGMRAQIAADAQAPSQSPLARVAAAFTSQPAAAPSPAVQTVAQAAASAPSAPVTAPSAGVDRVAAAVRVLNNPYAQPGQRAIAQMIVQQAFRDPAETEMKRLQLDKARRDAEGAPLEVEGRKLDIEQKRKNLGKADAPTVQRIKQPDQSEVAVQWDQDKKSWVPLVAPEGGNAVKAPTKLTEQQSKDLTYFNRGVQALEAFEKDGDAYANGLERGASQLPGGNYLNSEQFQKARQSGRNFLASILRKDSGAAITENEEKIYGEVFLPQPGDKPGMLAQKREARRQAIEAIKGGLGTAEVLARGSEILKAPSAQAPAPTAIPEGARAKGPNGEVITLRNGKWVRE